MAAARPSVDGMAGGAFLEGPASRNGFFIVVRRLSGFSNPTSVSNLLCSTLRFVPGLFVFMRRLARASPPWMPLCLACNALFFVAIMLSGCKLVSRGGPVSKELTTARRLSNEGLAAANEDDLVRAEGLLERAVRACPADIDARRYYADVLWKRGSRVEAVGQMSERCECRKETSLRRLLQVECIWNSDFSTTPIRCRKVRSHWLRDRAKPGTFMDKLRLPVVARTMRWPTSTNRFRFRLMTAMF